MGRGSLKASLKGIEAANKALLRNGLTQKALGEKLGISRSTISKFFNGKTVERYVFNEICSRLNLNWEEIFEPPPEEEQQKTEEELKVGADDGEAYPQWIEVEAIKNRESTQGEINLTDRKRKELIRIIKNTFKENEIKTICINHQETFSGDLQDGIAGDTFDDRLSYLIDFLNRKIKLQVFLEIAGENEPHFKNLVSALFENKGDGGNYKASVLGINSYNLHSALHFVV